MKSTRLLWSILPNPWQGQLISCKMSLHQGYLPLDWKMIGLLAIYNGDSRSEVGNYRQMTLISVLCKMLERIIRNHVCLHLKWDSMPCPSNMEFWNGSCLTNLFCFLDDVNRRPDGGMPIEVWYLESSRTFDLENRGLSLRRSTAFNACIMLPKWMGEVLIDGTFYIRVGEVSSNTWVVTSGVPQGSVPEQMLFVVFANDLMRHSSFSDFSLRMAWRWLGPLGGMS